MTTIAATDQDDHADGHDERERGRLTAVDEPAEQRRRQGRHEQAEAERREHGREPADQEQRDPDEHPGDAASRTGSWRPDPRGHEGVTYRHAGLPLRVVHHDVLMAGP